MSEEACTLNVDPGKLARYVVDVYGPAGVEWLGRLSGIIAGCARRWSLTMMPPFADLSYHYVAPAVREDGTRVVLKAGVPHLELRREIEALRCFDGEGAARLLEADPGEGVLLLECLVPGTPLADVEDDEQVTQVAAGVMRRLWRPAPAGHPFATVAEWANGLKVLRTHFHGGYGPFPPALVDRADELFQDLLGAGARPVLLHGDMHPQNILKGEREPWLAIDPKGVVGDPLYDVADFVCSAPALREESRLRATLERRVSQLGEVLGFDREQILDWSFAASVLSGWWSFEDHGQGWEWAFALAETIGSLPA